MRTRVGYAGGTLAEPTYRQLGDHSECLQVDFDPQRVSYAQLLELFWEGHRPASPPYKRQYRAVVLTGSEAQRQQAEASREAVAARLGQRVHTAVEPLTRFWLAEDSHQKYLLRRHADFMDVFARYPPRAFVDSTVAARLNGYVAGMGSLAQLHAEVADFGLPERVVARLEGLVRRQSRGRTEGRHF